MEKEILVVVLAKNRKVGMHNYVPAILLFYKVST